MRHCPRCDSQHEHELSCLHCGVQGCEHCIWVSDVTLNAFCAEELTLYENYRTRLIPTNCLELHYLDLLDAKS